MPNQISEFSGEFRWLSNFWPVEVVLDGESYPAVENAYQAAKTIGDSRIKFKTCTAGQAKRLGKLATMRQDWDDVKVDVMRRLIAQKFSPSSNLGIRLIQTGDAKIIEGNSWGDTFWGVCKGKGQNKLGELLMERRAELILIREGLEMPRIVNRKTPPAFKLERIPDTSAFWLQTTSPTATPVSEYVNVYQGNRKHRRAKAKKGAGK